MTQEEPLSARPPNSGDGGFFNRRGRFRRFLRLAGFFVVLIIAIVIFGFLRFADSVATLAPPDNPKADAIVVLTGGYQRIDQAVELLRSGSGRRLLISGAHPSTSSARIRKMTQSSTDLFNCCVDIGYDALDTIGNASEITRWIHDKGYRSVLVVTNNYHMQRSLMELRRIDHVTEFIPYPVVNSDMKSTDWYANPDMLRTLIIEYAKTLIVYARQLAGWGTSPGLRTGTASTSGARTLLMRPRMLPLAIDIV